MLANYTIGVPSYPVHGMPMQTSVPIVTQQALPTQQVPNNTSGLLEFSQMLVDTKVGMSRIDLKLDEVLKKVDSMKPEISSSNAIVPLSKSDTPLLVDPAMVLHSITQVRWYVHSFLPYNTGKPYFNTIITLYSNLYLSGASYEPGALFTNQLT